MAVDAQNLYLLSRRLIFRVGFFVTFIMCALVIMQCEKLLQCLLVQSCMYSAISAASAAACLVNSC